jgi:hypothetical protein
MHLFVTTETGSNRKSGFPLYVVSENDTIPPEVENFSIVKSISSALLSWSTNEFSKMSADYGQTTGFELGHYTNNGLKKKHTMILAGLSPPNTYYYKITTTDIMNNSSIKIDSLRFDNSEELNAKFHWKMDENSGNIVSDSRSNKNGMLKNGPAWRPSGGKMNGAVELDGMDDYIDIGTIDIESNEGLTIALWKKPDDFDIPDARLISKANGTTEETHFWMLSTINQSALRFRLKAGGATTTLHSTGGQLNAEEWNHIAATYNGAFMAAYKNGVEIANAKKTGIIDMAPTVPAAIGNQPNGFGSRPFDGMIDDVVIFGRALPEKEIKALCQGAGPIPASSSGKFQESRIPPATFQLHQNCPNPFYNHTVFSYELPPHYGKNATRHVSIEIYSEQGKSIIKLVNCAQYPGRYQATWNGINASGNYAKSGVYFYVLNVDNTIRLRNKLVLLKHAK